jgi:hypothetical protein
MSQRHYTSSQEDRRGQGAQPITTSPGKTGAYYNTQRKQRLNPDLIPQELRDLNQWVVWRLQMRKGKPTKVPFRARDPECKASSTDPKSWASFDEAMAAFLRDESIDGIGFVFKPDGPYAGVDFDYCLDPGGAIAEWAQAKLERFKGGWAAISPSNNGIKVIVRGNLSGMRGTNRKGFGPGGKGGIECYDRGRFFTITSDVLDAERTTIMGDHSAELQALRAELTRKLKKAKRLPDAQMAEVLSVDDGALLDRIRRSRQGAKFEALYDRGDTSLHNGDDSAADIALCCILAFWTNKDEDRIERLFNGSRLAQREKWGRADYRASTITAACEATTETYRPPSSKKERKEQPNDDTASREGADDERIEIEVSVRWHEVLEKTLPALKRDPDLYRRGDVLVTVTVETEDEIPLSGSTVLKGMAGTPRVIVLSPSNLGCHLTRVASFYRWTKGRSRENVAVQVHQFLLNAIFTHCHYPGVRPLLAVVECPYPRLDGSIVSTPGYDPTTGTIYRPSMRFPPIPNRPTREQAQEAARRLLAIVKQFPFPTDADRAVWLAALLTVIARPIIDGPVPGFALIGNKAGVGKGLLIDIIGIISTNRSVPTSTYPEEKEEAAKVKVSIALAGPPIVHFDNLDEGVFYGNGAFDSTLTSITVDDRILGSLKRTGDIALRSTFFLSGNNISPGKDAFRRWLPINLFSDLERPEERGDLADTQLRQSVMDHRAEHVRNALIILSAHAQEGYPCAPKAPLGSFEAWDPIVRGAVIYAYGHDPCQTRRKAADEAPARLAKIALLQGWKELPGGTLGGVTTPRAIQIVTERPDDFPTLHNALLHLGRDGGKPAGPKSLGNTIRAMKGNTIEGMRFVEAGKVHGTTLWKVEVHGGGSEGSGGSAFPPTRVSSTSHTNVIMSEKTLDGSKSRGEDILQSPQTPRQGDCAREVGEL